MKEQKRKQGKLHSQLHYLRARTYYFFGMNGISFHDQFIPDINTIFDRVH